MTSLEGLFLVHNRLSAIPVQIGQLRRLTKLYLSYNQLTSLPAEIGECTSLQELQLNSNRLTALPSSIGKLSELVELDVGSNKLTTLPPEVNGLTALEKLDLDGNKMQGMPANLRGLGSVESLSVRNALLYYIPPEIGHVTSLCSLDLSKNLLSTLPQEMGTLVNLEELTLTNNQFAQLPAVIGQLRNLRVLWLSNNQLTSLPDEISALRHLTKLYLYNNRLNSLPSKMGKLDALQTLQLNGNELVELPPSLCSLSKLRELNVRDNRLAFLPTTIGSMSALVDLDLRNNRLTELPNELCQLTSLTRLAVKNNPIESPPADVCEKGINAIVGHLAGEGKSTPTIPRLSSDARAVDPDAELEELDIAVMPSYVHTAPEVVQEMRIKLGESAEVGEDLRMWLSSDDVTQSIIQRNNGDVQQLFLSAALLPSYETDGMSPLNFVRSWIQPNLCLPVRLDKYRWRVRRMLIERDNVYTDVLVERLETGKTKLIEEPLKIGATKSYWLSSHGTEGLAFSAGGIYASFTFWATLRLNPPTPTQTDDGTWVTADGGWTAYLNMIGENDYRLQHPSSSSFRRYIIIQNHRIDFHEFEMAEGTTFSVVNGRSVLCTTDGRTPSLSVCLLVTRLPEEISRKMSWKGL